MQLIRYVFLLGMLLGAVACSKAIPTVTTLLPASPDTPSSIGETAFGISSGGGEMSGTVAGTSSFKVFSKIGPRNTVMKGLKFRIHTSGDN